MVLRAEGIRLALGEVIIGWVGQGMAVHVCTGVLVFDILKPISRKYHYIMYTSD